MSIDTFQMILNQMSTAIDLYPSNSLWIKAIPAVISVFNELIMFCDAREVEERLSDLEAKVEELEISNDQFIDSVNSLSYHDKYAFRNFLKSYCLETLPEVTDAMIYALIDFATDQKSGIQEEVCEILKQFNSIDIKCMKRIKSIVNNEEITKKRRNEAAKIVEGQKSKRWKDNVLYIPGKTVIWDDFVEYKGEETDETENATEWIPNVCDLMFGSFVNDEKEEAVLSQSSRSLIKLQNLGVLIIFNQMLLGDSPMFNIQKFTLTNYGLKILEYLK
jgi:tetrahydromethanopterin S-methyltransferase subunit B